MKNKKQIWVINQFAGTPESGWGERHFFFAKHWVAAGYDVRIISGSYNHMFKKLPYVPGRYKIEDYAGVNFVWVKTPEYDPLSIKRFYSMLVFAFKILFLPVKKLGKPDIVIVSSMPIFPIITGYFFKLRYGSRLIFEIRDLWPLTLQYLGEKPSWHPAVKLIGWFEKFGYRNSDYVVSLLPNAKKYMELTAGTKINFHYIPNGVDYDILGIEKLPNCIVEKIPKDKFIVGYAGTIGKANALEYLIDASCMMHNEDNIFFVVVGDGYLKNKLVDMAKHNNNILFIPKIPKAQVQSIISLFDLCFIGRHDSPLYGYGVSANKYFDYMLASKPILDSNRKIKDPVELSGCGLIVRPCSASAIVDGIKFFYNMPKEEKENIGRKGHEYVLKNHNIKELSHDYALLF